MASTHTNITRLRPRPGTPAYELEAEDAAVEQTIRENAARRARRRAAWGMPPLLGYAILTAVAVLYLTIGWIVFDLADTPASRPDVMTEAPATTPTGTIPGPRP